MRVVHLQKATGVAGSERHLLSLLPELRSRGVDARMCVLLASGGEPFVEAMRAAGVPTSVLPAGPDLDPALLLRLVRILRAERPALLHTHLVHADVYGQLAARAARVPGVSTIHGTMPEFERQPYRSAVAIAGRCARRTIAISEFAARFAVEHGLVPPDRLKVVLYGVEVDRWTATEAERRAARAAFGLADGTVAIGVASRLVAEKGHDFLLEGFAAARRVQAGLRLLVAGDGPLRHQLEEQARPLGDTVDFLGFLHQDRLELFMHACDLLAFPTLPGFGEGFGLAALEASAAGRPVVATDVASLPEVVAAGETGLLVPPGDVGSLAGALVHLARDPARRAEMGAAGEARARERFALGRMADETLAVYEEVVGPR